MSERRATVTAELVIEYSGAEGAPLTEWEVQTALDSLVDRNVGDRSFYGHWYIRTAAIDTMTGGE